MSKHAPTEMVEEALFNPVTELLEATCYYLGGVSIHLIFMYILQVTLKRSSTLIFHITLKNQKE